jgi:hypothetical protein
MRALVVALVLTAGASAAFAQVEVVPNPYVAANSPSGEMNWFVFSLRNTGTSSIHVSSIDPPPVDLPGDPWCATSPAGKPVDPNLTLPLDIAGGHQVQFYTSFNGGLQRNAYCNMTISPAQSPSSAVPLTLGHPNMPVPKGDIQPYVLDFGTISVGSSDDQFVWFVNYTGGTLNNTNWTATITNPQGDTSAFSFPGAGCDAPGTTCASSMSFGNISYHQATVRCTPATQVTSTAQLNFNVGGTSYSATLTCKGGAGSSGPSIDVTPISVTVTDQPVQQQSTATTIHVKNTGGQPLTGVVFDFVGAGAGDWSASDCLAMSACTVAPGGQKDVDITLTPSTYTDRSATLNISSNDAAHDPFSVTLTATAKGGLLTITDPSSLELDFGTLPRNQLAQKSIGLANPGNLAIDVAVSASAPFSASPASTTVMGSSSATVVAGCQSDTANDYDGYFTLTSMAAYAGKQQMIHATCSVAPTDIMVTPSSFEFGEVRLHSAAVTKAITIANPTAVASSVTRLALVGARPGLALSGGFTSSHQLVAGASIAATLTLTPSSNTDLAGTSLEIDVDGTTLMYPITGRVVTPHSYVVPPKLDLGTSCVGDNPHGTVLLVNDGTATLQVDAPIPGDSFAAATTDVYPASLAAGGYLAADVTPTMTTVGEASDTLEWDDDVPSQYKVPIAHSFISTGVAVSPLTLGFPPTDPGAVSAPQKVQLESCDAQEVAVRIVRSSSSSGSADAWQISPSSGMTIMLEGSQPQDVFVAFAPLRPGHYEAELELDVGGTTRKVALYGDAPGEVTQPPSSFYACSAATGGSFATIAIALAFAARRRRLRRITD